MTMIRFLRIDNLLKEAEDIQNLETERDDPDNQNQSSFQGYQGERLNQIVIKNLRREIFGYSTVILKLLQTLVQVGEAKQFLKELVLDDI